MRTCTKEQLIEALKDLPKGAKVAFSADYGDRCHTQQVVFIDGNISEENIYESGYSDSGYAVDSSGEEESSESVWIIS